VPLLRDGDAEVREAVALTLGELKRPDSATALLPYLGDPTPDVKAAALRAVKALRVDEAFEPALTALHDGDATVRREAVGVLGYLRRPQALGALTEVAAHDPDPEVRRVAVGVLGYAGECTEISVHPALSRAMVDAAWQVREEAATTLGKLGSALGVNDLITAMADEYWQVRVKAARSLGKLKARAAVPALADALLHPMSNLRKEAVIALGETGDPRAITPLEKALGDSDPDVRKLAKLALTTIQMAGGAASMPGGAA
jgi:HEAT repeat protein